MGASNFDIDTEQGWVRFSLHEPAIVDFKQVADILQSASYELRTIEITLEGEVLNEPGGTWLVVGKTGQRFPVDANPTSPEARKIRALVLGWDTDSPRLRLAEGTDLPR